MAASFYIKNGGSRSHIAGLIPYIRDGKGSLRVWFYYPEVTSGSDFDPIYHDICHRILVKADRKERILYSYIELFNAIKYFVLLNENYYGPNLKMDYCWNVSSRKKIKKSSNLDISRRQVSVKGRRRMVSQSKQQMSKNLGRLVRTIRVTIECNEIGRVFEYWSDNLLRSISEVTITGTSLHLIAVGRHGFLLEIFDHVWSGFLKWLGAAHGKTDAILARRCFLALLNTSLEIAKTAYLKKHPIGTAFDRESLLAFTDELLSQITGYMGGEEKQAIEMFMRHHKPCE